MSIIVGPHHLKHLGMTGGLLMTAIASKHRAKSRQSNRS